MTGTITRRHRTGDARSLAVYSGCEGYRYQLARIWNPEGPELLYVMLNPSTATETRNDPTVERCERRARTLGYGGFRVANLFAWRATAPREWRAAADPVGPGNDAALAGAAHRAGRILCGWGAHGAHLGRGRQVEALLRRAGRPLFHLGLTRGGQPRHPLYVAYAQQPERWG